MAVWPIIATSCAPHSPQDTLDVEVLRFDTQEVLAGQLNGRPLEQSFSFAQELGGEVADNPPAASGDGGGQTAATYDYVVITDNSNSMRLEVPTQWSDVDGSPWLADDGSDLGGSLAAAPNLDDFLNTFSTPGVYFVASEALKSAYGDVGALLDDLQSEYDCTYEGRSDYGDSVYTGQYDFYSSCGDTSSVLITLAAEPADGAYMVWLTMQIIDDADLDALDHLLNSFEVIGTLPGSTGQTSGGDSGGQTQDTGSSDIPADWYPPAGQASIVIDNQSSMDLTFTMANIETKLVAGTSQVVYYPAGKHTFTAAAPGFDSQNSECTLNPDTIYNYVSDDSSWGNCVQIYP